MAQQFPSCVYAYAQQKSGLCALRGAEYLALQDEQTLESANMPINSRMGR